jgi:transcriptional regulator with XRE-family HTH domain
MARLKAVQGRLRYRKTGGPQPSRPAVTPLPIAYALRVRNTDPRQVWAAYLKRLMAAAGIKGPDLAQRLGIHPSTVWRWETGKQKPESPAAPEAIAELFKLDPAEVLAAAGLASTVEPTTEPTREVDEEIDLIMTAPVDDATRRRMLERLHYLREQDKQRRMEDIRFHLDRRA